MCKFIIQAAIESLVFALCMTGLIALGYSFIGQKLTNNEVSLSMLLGFIGWYIWIVINTFLLKKKR